MRWLKFLRSIMFTGFVYQVALQRHMELSRRFRSMNFSLFFILTALMVTQAQAQAKPLVYLDFDDGKAFVSDGKTKIEPGFFTGYDLRDMVKENPKALELANDHRYYNKVAVWSWIGSTIVYFGLNINDWSHDKYSNFSLYTAGYLFFNIFWTGHYGRKSHQSLLKTINTYNGVYEKTEPKVSLNVAPVSSGGAFVLSYRF